MSDSCKPPYASVQSRVAAHRPNPVVAIGQSIVPFIVALGLAFVMDKVIGPAAGATWSKILLDVGIAILLAGSLNVVNGYAGQFSIGHAGFMLVGGYAAAWLTFYGSVHWGISTNRESLGGQGIGGSGIPTATACSRRLSGSSMLCTTTRSQALETPYATDGWLLANSTTVAGPIEAGDPSPDGWTSASRRNGFANAAVLPATMTCRPASGWGRSITIDIVVVVSIHAASPSLGDNPRTVTRIESGE